ncbi:MAG TPA: NIPSNAP family protein [Candidatus Sulfotelmatobacter sp.]|nr:NIPSNAP family protein [Candidatus Sulfotelmatobacter sp.]
MQEVYELRRYQLRFGSQADRLDRFLSKAAIPAWNRAGLGPIGVFTSLLGAEIPSTYVVLPAPSLEVLIAARSRLAGDAEFLEAGKDFLGAPVTDPAFDRLESSLLVALRGLPRLEVPLAAAKGGPRIFELRRYESHSDQAVAAKVGMFNSAELEIFRRNGLRAVFFGEALIGPRLPNLTYLLTFEDVNDREESWAAFRADPEWRRLLATPGLDNGDILTTIQSVLLAPAACSEI